MRLRIRTRNRLLGVTAAILIMVVGTFWATPSKAAVFLVFHNTKYNWLCLDDSAAYGLRMYTCSPDSQAQGYQGFDAIYETGYGFFYMPNAKTHLCVDASAAYGVRDFPCNNASYVNGYQGWRTYSQDNFGNSQLQNVATNRCLDYSDQYGLRVYPCNYASFVNGYQAWYITPA
jgi:hypothetical protein